MTIIMLNHVASHHHNVFGLKKIIIIMQSIYCMQKHKIKEKKYFLERKKKFQSEIGAEIEMKRVCLCKIERKNAKNVCN